jgi:hypothetical protein
MIAFASRRGLPERDPLKSDPSCDRWGTGIGGRIGFVSQFSNFAQNFRSSTVMPGLRRA